MTMVTYTQNGTRVKEGDEVIDFRGDKATFVQATRARFPGHSGKVIVSWEGAGGVKRGGEYYDKVFGLIVEEEEEPDG